MNVDIHDVWMLCDSLSDRKRILRESHLPEEAKSDRTDLFFLGYELALRDLCDLVAELEANISEALIEAGDDSPCACCQGCHDADSETTK